MTDPITGSGHVQSFKLSELGLKKEAEQLIEKETITTQDGQVEAHVFDQEEAALKFASKDTGDEAVIHLPDGRWAVLDVKSQNHDLARLNPELTQRDQFNQLKIKAEALFDPTAQTSFPDRILSRTRVYEGPDGNRETGMDRLEVLPGATDTQQAEQHLALAKIAVQAEVGGFNPGLSTNTVKGDMYASNLTTVVSGLNTSIASIEARCSKLEQELKTLQAEKQQASTGNGLVDPGLDDKVQELQKLKSQLDEMSSYRTVLQAKLLILPQSEHPVPGLNLQIGAYRNPRDHDKAESLIRQRLGTLQNQYGSEADPSRKASLQQQIDLLQTAATQMGRSSLQIQEASLSIQVRLGALATINTRLVDAKDSLSKDIGALNALYLELHVDPKAALNYGAADSRIQALEAKINTDRQNLILAMEAELKTFKEHAPKLGGKLQSGAAETVALLEKQIEKLKQLGLVAGKPNLLVCQEVLQTVDDTQSQFSRQLEQASLEKIDKAAKIWEGISPEEARQVHDIVSNTQKYTEGYAEAKKGLKDVFDKQEIAHKVVEFEKGLYSLQENPTMTDAIVDVAVRTNDGPLKTQMLFALSSSPIPDTSVESFGTRYQELITAAVKNAKEGTKLYELQQCYSAMGLSKTDDWKDRVDMEKLQAKITALSQEPEIQKAFESAQAEAIQTTFGDRQAAAAKLESFILSDDFQRRMKLMSPDQQKALIQTELHKLTILAPDRVMEVSKHLMMKNFEAHGADAYVQLSPKDGASAFETLVKSSKKFSKFANGVGQFSKVMDKALREVAMSSGEKTPDAVIRALQRLQASNPSAAKAIEFMTEWKSSGKLGSLDGLFAGMALISKGFPHDAISTLDSSSSLFSLLSKGEDFAKFFGMTDDALKIGKLGKTLHFMKWLGPAADFIGAGLDFYKMTDEIKHGDTWGAVGKGVSGAGGLAAGAAGVALLAGASGPAAPIVLVGGIVVGLIGWAIDSGAGESPEETLLREVGVLKPAPAPPPSEYDDYDPYMYMGMP